MSPSRVASLALLVVTLIWGATFVWMKEGGDAIRSIIGESREIEAVSFFLTLRFLLAALVILIFVPRVRCGLASRSNWVGGFLIACPLWAGFMLQMLGLVELSSATSAFLTSLYVMFTAIFVMVIERRSLRFATALGVLLATLGGAFISGPPTVHFNRPEWITVGCALMFALHILVTDRVTSTRPAMPVTFVTFVFVGLGSLVSLLVNTGGEGRISASTWMEVLKAREFYQPLLLSTLLATVVALSLMNRYQKDLAPVRAAIIYALEPIWATLYALGQGQRPESWKWLLIGGTALILGNLVTEVLPRREITPKSVA